MAKGDLLKLRQYGAGINQIVQRYEGQTGKS
jgi:hypothetical protein